jgi:prepilin-type N-terminal cleavage/methylation domain-containing protein
MMINNKLINLKKTNKGFSIIETMVATTILLIAIVAPLTIVQRSFSDARVVKNQSIAVFLAQDAMEYVRNVRNTNIIVGSGWLNFIDGCSGADGCIVDTTDVYPTVVPCIGDCANLRFDPTDGLYGYNPTYTETLFTRSVRVVPIGGAEEAVVIVNISWVNGAFTSSYQLVENILNWNG